MQNNPPIPRKPRSHDAPTPRPTHPPGTCNLHRPSPLIQAHLSPHAAGPISKTDLPPAGRMTPLMPSPHRAPAMISGVIHTRPTHRTHRRKLHLVVGVHAAAGAAVARAAIGEGGGDGARVAHVDRGGIAPTIRLACRGRAIVRVHGSALARLVCHG